MGRKSNHAKQSLPPDLRAVQRAASIRKYRKTVLFNERELSAINQYCEKYGVRAKSALFRNIIISHILQQADDNYPKLF